MIIIKVPCIAVYVTVLGCVDVFMQRLQQLLPSFTLLVCAVLLQPGAKQGGRRRIRNDLATPPIMGVLHMRSVTGAAMTRRSCAGRISLRMCRIPMIGGVARPCPLLY